MKPGATITIRNASYEVIHVEEASPRTKAGGIARAITVKPEDGDCPYTALQRRNGTIFGLTVLP